MKLIDASGPLYEGMWSYGTPYPDYRLKQLENPGWVDFKASSQEFIGLSTATGTYIDGPSHALGLKNADPMHKIPLDKLFDVDAYVLKFDLDRLDKQDGKPYISLDDIKQTEKEDIAENSNIIFATGWGQHWDKPDFLTSCWFFKKDAMEYIVSKKPFMLGIDTPSIDNVKHKQGLWPLIFNNNIYLLAPLVNIENIEKSKVKLYVCPLKALNTTGLPCRVIIKEEDQIAS
ncbi:MAG: cyclase family protein [Actinomycetota bacterium]|jgi:kynurenine formamidase|nr:cyclase family protein [Actinomycetota bacterium]